MKLLSAPLCLLFTATDVSAQSLGSVSDSLKDSFSESISNIKNALWRSPNITSSIDGSHEIKVTVSPLVDSITIEYGYDASPLYASDNNNHRRLEALLSSNQVLLQEQEFQSRSTSSKINNRAHAGRNRRRLQQDYDPFFVFGGTVQGEYVHGSHYKANWNETFSVLVEPAANKKSELYVLMDEASKTTFPCIYFPYGNLTTADVIAMVSLDDAIASGGEVGHVSFNTSTGAFTLYSNETAVPNSAGGQFVPDVYVSGSIPGSNTSLSNLFGGIDGTVFDWTPTSKFTVTTLSAKDYLINRGVEKLTIDVYAENENLGLFAFALFDVDTQGNVELADLGLEGGNQRSQRPSSAVELVTGTSVFLAMTTSLLSSW
ncbi:unnamed protein product [Cylindrotheca closterium]|uniref:Uncharacterized protein n=1 Tax=Cylindrotheca closterium TaxID=2856 RepID=A0AAD2G0J2_9STRA|nr:unnamed protein product [Cylindrotheca closterium]